MLHIFTQISPNKRLFNLKNIPQFQFHEKLEGAISREPIESFTQIRFIKDYKTFSLVSDSQRHTVTLHLKDVGTQVFGFKRIESVHSDASSTLEENTHALKLRITRLLA
jgi:hypothetical protein